MKHSRFVSLTGREHPGDRLVVVGLYEFSSVDDALFFRTCEQELSRVKDEKMKTGLNRITASSTKSARGKGWQGVVIEKQVNAGGVMVSVSFLLARKGNIVLEMTFSNEPTSGQELETLADVLFDRVVRLE